MEAVPSASSAKQAPASPLLKPLVRLEAAGQTARLELGLRPERRALPRLVRPLVKRDTGLQRERPRLRPRPLQGRRFSARPQAVMATLEAPTAVGRLTGQSDIRPRLGLRLPSDPAAMQRSDAQVAGRRPSPRAPEAATLNALQVALAARPTGRQFQAPVAAPLAAPLLALRGKDRRQVDLKASEKLVRDMRPAPAEPADRQGPSASRQRRKSRVRPKPSTLLFGPKAAAY